MESIHISKNKLLHMESFLKQVFRNLNDLDYLDSYRDTLSAIHREIAWVQRELLILNIVNTYTNNCE